MDLSSKKRGGLLAGKERKKKKRQIAQGHILSKKHNIWFIHQIPSHFC